MKLSPREWRVVRYLSNVGAAGSTVDEYLSAGNLYVNSWAPVFTGLKKRGLIEALGVTRKTRHGADANVHRLTTSGWDVLVNG